MKEITCPGEVNAKAEPLKASGEGYGSSKQVALDQARTQAKQKLDATVDNYVCLGTCEKSVDADPDYDDGRPQYSPWPDTDSKSFKCIMTEARPVKITCKQKSAGMVLSFADSELVTFLQEQIEHRSEVKPEDIIALITPSEAVIRVRKGNAEKVLSALKAKQVTGGWQVAKFPAPLRLEEGEGNPSTPRKESPKAARKGPEVGSIRILANRECGPEIPEREGPCRQIFRNPGIWANVTILAHSRCVRGDWVCVEDYGPIGVLGFYTDPDCAIPLVEVDLNGWSC